MKTTDNEKGGDKAPAAPQETVQPKAAPLCTACVSCKGKMRAYGAVYLCMDAASKSLVTGEAPATCQEMRATICGKDADRFIRLPPAKT